MNKPRILITRSNPIAPDPRVEKTARTLCVAGYPVTLLGWDRTGLSPAVHQEENGIRIFRLPVHAEFGKGLGNLPNLLRWQIRLFRWLVAHRREYDIIHACDFDTVLPALLCKRLWGKRVIYDIFDFYADHLRATPTSLKRLIRWGDLKAIGWADALILVDDSRWEQIAGAQPKRSAVIYNSPEEPSFLLGQAEKPEMQDGLYTASEAGTPASMRPAAKLRLAYIGLLQVERGLLEILDVLGRHPEWSLDLAGFGGDEEQILAIARALPNVNWHGRVPYPQALELSRNADILFATYDPSISNHRYSSPNKVFEAMLLGKPVLVARNTNMDRMIEEAGCGLVVDYGDVPSLEKALTRLQKDEELRRHLGSRARAAYETRYSWAAMQARLLKLYDEVTGSRSIK
jgi:glycosyltransferase involved in cell wall biosynthesis